VSTNPSLGKRTQLDLQSIRRDRFALRETLAAVGLQQVHSFLNLLLVYPKSLFDGPSAN